MKKNLLFIGALSLLSVSAFCQTIPNAGFENWTTTTYSDPDNWGTLNSATSSFGGTTVDQGTPGNPGTYYVKITSKTIAPLGVVPGIAVTGTINISTQTASGGFAFASRPVNITGKWQYMAMSGSDQGSITVFLSHWNTSTNSKDTVSYTSYLLPGMVMAWANFTIPLTYQSALTPDTAMIILAASNSTPAANSYLYIDNLAFTGNVGISENNTTENNLTVYPNPAENLLNVSFTLENSSAVKIQLLDISGKLIEELNPAAAVGKNNAELNLEGIESGIYFIRLISDKGIENRKIVIE